MHTYWPRNEFPKPISHHSFRFYLRVDSVPSSIPSPSHSQPKCLMYRSEQCYRRKSTYPVGGHRVMLS